ncbi:MAG: carbohydrate kinase [Armatimonadetes bacterium]|nr:carbohydrate kinase [Armatimonadota bacterium]
MSRPVIVGIGEVLWDLLPDGKFLGGAPGNFAFHASQLGAEGIVASAVGRDALGDEIIERLDSLGLSTEYVQRNDAPTGTVTATLDAEGKATYIIHENTAWDQIHIGEDDAWGALALRADAVCFGSLAQRTSESRSSIQRFAFLASVRPRCLRIFDINLRQSYYSQEVVDTSLLLADAFKLNDEELPVVAELLELAGNEAELVAALWEKYPSLRVVALTRGASGSTLFTRFRRSDHPGYPLAEGVTPDTVGAGDSFTAALAVGLLHFDDLDTLHDKASRLAAFVCSQPGGTPLHSGTMPPL